MDKRASSKAVAILLAVFCAGVSCLLTVASKGTASDRGQYGRGYYLQYQFSTLSDDSNFYAEAFQRISPEKLSPSKQQVSPVQIGIVSHHLLIKNLIAEYFAKIASEIQPSTIILIGPNHRSRGKHPLSISQLPWKTPFGFVHPDLPFIRELTESRFVDLDENAFYNEHSIGALVPFIQRYFPKSFLVPIVVKPDADTSEVLHLASWLAQHTQPAHTLVLASLDFSHRQTSSIAQQQDGISLDVIRSFHYDQWKRAFVDSRKSLLLILQLAILTHSTQFELVQHTNSGILENKPGEPCTSYINSIFRSERH